MFESVKKATIKILKEIKSDDSQKILKKMDEVTEANFFKFIRENKKIDWNKIQQDAHKRMKTQIGGGNRCTICFEEVSEEDDEYMKLSCGHIFHKSCIRGWLEMHNTCPNCRAQVSDSERAELGVVQGWEQIMGEDEEEIRNWFRSGFLRREIELQRERRNRIEVSMFFGFAFLFCLWLLTLVRTTFLYDDEGHVVEFGNPFDSELFQNLLIGLITIFAPGQRGRRRFINWLAGYENQRENLQRMGYTLMEIDEERQRFEQDENMRRGGRKKTRRKKRKRKRKKRTRRRKRKRKRSRKKRRR